MENLEEVRRAIESRYHCTTYTSESSNGKSVFIGKEPRGEMSWYYVPNHLIDIDMRDEIIRLYRHHYFEGSVNGRDLEIILIDSSLNRKIIEQTFFIPPLPNCRVPRPTIWYYSIDSNLLTS